MLFYEPGTHKAHGFRHDPFKAFVSPRPIGWVSTVNADGVSNLSPYSFFNAVCSDPPCIMFAAGSRPDGSRKDSHANAEDTGEFVLSIVAHAQREAMNESSIGVPPATDEFPISGLEGEPSRLVKPLRVKGAPVHFECKYLQTVEMPCWRQNGKNSVVFGQVVGIHVDESIIQDGLVDVLRYKPVARLGYMDYTTVTDVYAMDRPDAQGRAEGLGNYQAAE